MQLGGKPAPATKQERKKRFFFPFLFFSNQRELEEKGEEKRGE
jgi:hypothetical protein